MMIEKGKQVSIEYRLRLDDGTEVSSNVGKEPYTYVQGTLQIVPGVERELEGMNAGEDKSFVVEPEEGFGERSEEAFQEVNKSVVPKESRRVDAQLEGQDEQGGVFVARVAELKDDTVVLDLNHPLAGETLHFDVKVLDVKDAAG